MYGVRFDLKTKQHIYWNFLKMYTCGQMKTLTFAMAQYIYICIGYPGEKTFLWDMETGIEMKTLTS